MKKVTTVIVLMIALVATMNAQKVNKFGYLNSNELISLMPEMVKADSAIDKYAMELDALGQQMYGEYQKKATDAQTKKGKNLLTPEQEELVVKELSDLEKRITDFQESAQQKIETKRDKLYAPIVAKANEGIQAVAKANGYTYVFDSGAGMLLYADEADDILPLVKKHLKLPDPKPTPSTKPGMLPK